MLKPRILDPQGRAVTGVLKRIGFDGMTVRQDRHFEVEVDGEIAPEALERVSQAAEKLFANTAIETRGVAVS